ncbi:MAG: DUF721 domain-containing protein [Microthrixaceae bacterium]|nr:DUF721 domain-containing protein [Acidimicrobiales bacterium]MCB9403236.1 DUF721 domain-containing protein [Microthrixaceae bacterium]
MSWAPLPSSSRDGGKGPAALSDLLDVVMAGLGAPKADVVLLVHDRWDDVVGSEVAAHVHPVNIEDGCLRVVADGPAWASHLRWAEPEIIARLENLLGSQDVRSVSVRVGRK